MCPSSVGTGSPALAILRFLRTLAPMIFQSRRFGLALPMRKAAQQGPRRMECGRRDRNGVTGDRYSCDLPCLITPWFNAGLEKLNEAETGNMVKRDFLAAEQYRRR